MASIRKDITVSILIDDEDLHIVDGASIHVNISKGKAYLDVYKNGVRKKLHRVIMGVDGEYVVDHINGDTLDNRKENLRIATQKQNSYNRKSKARYKGIKLLNGSYRAKPYQARITQDGKEISLGCYKTEEEAAEAYNTKAIELFGEFASLNDIETK